jgi:hypothetical protein
MAATEEACHDWNTRRIACLPSQCLAHCRQRQRIIDIRIAEGIIGCHTNVPGVVLLCPHPL